MSRRVSSAPSASPASTDRLKLVLHAGLANSSVRGTTRTKRSREWVRQHIEPLLARPPPFELGFVPLDVGQTLEESEFGYDLYMRAGRNTRRTLSRMLEILEMDERAISRQEDGILDIVANRSRAVSTIHLFRQTSRTDARYPLGYAGPQLEGSGAMTKEGPYEQSVNQCRQSKLPYPHPATQNKQSQTQERYSARPRQAEAF